MTTLNLIVTDTGRAEIINATNTGTLPVVISEIALGTGRWVPDATATALNTEIKRINTIGGVAVADDTIHLTMADYSSDVYSLGEFGLYTDTGVLFAIYSDAVNGITDKAADAALLIATDTVFTTIAPGTITVNGAGFTNPPASETVQGVMEIADQLEVDTGTDHTRAVTPQTLASILSMYLLSAGYNAADVLAKLLTVDGAGSGLDADVWQGLTPAQLIANNGLLSFVPVTGANGELGQLLFTSSSSSFGWTTVDSFIMETGNAKYAVLQVDAYVDATVAGSTRTRAVYVSARGGNPGGTSFYVNQRPIVYVHSKFWGGGAPESHGQNTCIVPVNSLGQFDFAIDAPFSPTGNASMVLLGYFK